MAEQSLPTTVLNPPVRADERVTAVEAARPAGPPVVAAPPAQSPPEPSERRRPRRRWLVMAVLAALVIGGGAITAYRWWFDSTHFVSTDNAQIAGHLVPIGSLQAGRVSEVKYDVGARVAAGEVIAQLRGAVPVGTTRAGTPRLEFRETIDSLEDVRSPIAGVVVARNASPGDTVPAGQPLLTVFDPNQLWINANIEENQIRRVQTGQRVTVHVDALDLDLAGRVIAITPASAATFSLLPSQNSSGNFTKVTQLIPVKIALVNPDPRLAIGTSAGVKIQTRD